MKKILYFALFLLLPFASRAQITLDPGDWPYPGLSVWLLNVDADTGSTYSLKDSITIGSPGPGGSYDFSNLDFGMRDTSLFNFVSILSTPWAAQHPAANISVYAGADTVGTDTVMMFWQHMNNTGNHLYATGYTFIIDSAGLLGGTPTGNYDTIHRPITPYDTLVNTSFALGYSYTDSSSWNITIGNFAHDESRKEFVTVDGWGTAQTFFGPMNVLRTKTIVYESFTDYFMGFPVDGGQDTLAEVTYWAKTIGFPLATVYGDTSLNNIYNIETVAQFVSTGIAESFKDEVTFEVFPNPADAYTIVRIPEAVKGPGNFFLTDMNGRVVAVRASVAGQTEYRFNTADLPAGMYFIRGVMLDGEALGTVRIAIQH